MDSKLVMEKIIHVSLKGKGNGTFNGLFLNFFLLRKTKAEDTIRRQSDLTTRNPCILMNHFISLTQRQKFQ